MKTIIAYANGKPIYGYENTFEVASNGDEIFDDTTATPDETLVTPKDSYSDNSGLF